MQGSILEVRTYANIYPLSSTWQSGVGRKDVAQL